MCNPQLIAYGLKTRNGIRRQLTTAYTLQQNGIAERKNRTRTERLRCMLLESRALLFLWGEFINAANYLLNRCPTRANSGLTPEEKFTGSPPDLSHLRVIGCTVYIKINKPGIDNYVLLLVLATWILATLLQRISSSLAASYCDHATCAALCSVLQPFNEQCIVAIITACAASLWP